MNDIPYFINKLHADDLLPQVISTLNNNITQAQAMKFTEIRFHGIFHFFQLPSLTPNTLAIQVPILKLSFNICFNLLHVLLLNLPSWTTQILRTNRVLKSIQIVVTHLWPSVIWGFPWNIYSFEFLQILTRFDLIFR